MGVWERHYGDVIHLIYDGVKAKAITWFQILQYSYVHISTISVYVRP